MHSFLRNIALSSVMAAALFASGCASYEDVESARAFANSAQISAEKAQASADKAQATADRAMKVAENAQQTAHVAHARINNMGTYGGHAHKHKRNGERADSGETVSPGPL